MAKKKSLLEQVNAGEPAKRKCDSWWIRFERQQPEMYAEVVKVVLDFEARGETYKHHLSKLNLYRRLMQLEAIPPIGISQFRAFFHTVVSK